MASFAGWFGDFDYPTSVLTRMTDGMDGLNPVHEQHLSGRFAVRTSQPGLAGEISRIAVGEDGHTVLAFAGYLYTEDDEARTSPASHCLELYRKNGLEFARELNGTFALAIADTARDELHLVSDRLSTRPIYCARHGGGLLFGTEVKALLAAPDFAPTPSEERMLEFIAIECVTSGNTLYDVVHKVAPGTVMTWDGREETSTKYWAPIFTWDDGATIEESARRIAQALKAATCRVVAGHDRVGLMLSGGLDSRAIAAASPIPLQCMTMHMHEGPEVRTARRVAEMLGYSWDLVELPATYPLEMIDQGTQIADGMNSFYHAQGLYQQQSVLAQESSLILNGWILGSMFAGSKLNGGSPSLLRRLLPPSLSPATAVKPARDLISIYLSASNDNLLALAGSAIGDLLENLECGLAEEGVRLREGCRSEHDVIDLLAISDMSSVRSYLNTRSLGRLTTEGIPAWDNELFDAYLNTAPQHRFNHTAYRQAIVMLNRELARIPHSLTGAPVASGPLREHCQRVIRDGSRFLSRRLLRALRFRARQPQTGSWPSTFWAMSRHVQWRELLRQRAASSRLVQMGLIEGAALNRIVEAQIAGDKNNVELLVPWLTLEQWLQEYH